MRIKNDHRHDFFVVFVAWDSEVLNQFDRVRVLSVKISDG